MLLLILESFGSTELLFILVMALIFFGPRKLPQISRSLGKSMAEFRRASEDFKRTWEKEVAMENPLADVTASATSQENKLLIKQPNSSELESIATEYTVARDRRAFAKSQDNLTPGSIDPSDPNSESNTQQPSLKRDWL